MAATALGRRLVAAFAAVPDPRSRHGRRHPLPAILSLATAAMVSGARSVDAIAQWGRRQRPAGVAALGFTRPQTPAGSTRHEVVKALDVRQFEAALQRWAEQQVGQGRQALTIDGKALRGLHGEEVPGVRLIAVYAQAAGLGLAPAGGRDQHPERTTGD